MDLPKRKPNRLKDYDYSSEGAYFITICSHKHKNLFADIVGAIHESPAAEAYQLILKPYGKIIDHVIRDLPARFGIEVNKYVIMPNHIHLIIMIDKNGLSRAIRESPLQKRSLISKTVGYLKMNVSKEIHKTNTAENIWQRSFHDHVIRGENDYQKIWTYIDNNPAKWKDDCFYAETPAGDL